MCRVKAKIKRKSVVLQTIGYRGKKEAKTPAADLRQARALILYKKDVKKVGVKVGSTVTVKVGRKKVPCEVKRWSRGSRLLLPKTEYPFKNIKNPSRYLVH